MSYACNMEESVDFLITQRNFQGALDFIDAYSGSQRDATVSQAFFNFLKDQSENGIGENTVKATKVLDRYIYVDSGDGKNYTLMGHDDPVFQIAKQNLNK